MEHLSNSPKPVKSNFNLLLVLFITFIALSLASLAYYQKMMHESDSLPNSTGVAQYETKMIRMGGQVFVADVADTDQSREQGLSGRLSLGENQAMLFIFPSERQNIFWMKDMLFSIDIIWLDKDKKIVYMKKNAAPESYPETFGPSIPTRYVIEVRAGIAEKIGLRVGDSVNF